MREYTQILTDVQQTINEMKRLSTDYMDDIRPFCVLNFLQFFYYLKNLPFIPDPAGEEYVNRPGITLAPGAKHRDCDCKATALKAYCNYFNIPARFVASSSRASGELHHVYIDVYVNGNWRPCDATYPENNILWERPYTRKEIF